MKDKILAALLAIFLGTYGIHKFYIGNPNAWKYLLFCWTGIPTFMGFFQGIKYLFMSNKDFDLLVMKESGIVGKKMIEQIRVNEHLNTFNNKYNAPNIPPQIKYELTGEFYNKLNMFALDISAIANVLKINQTLLNECSNNPGIITDCICYDMVQIFGMLYGANFDNTKLEEFACFILLPNVNSEIIASKSYQEIANNFQSKKYDKVIKDTISYYISYDNPLLHFSNKNSLALPSALKQIDSNLFNRYANTLNNYAKLLSMANEIATLEEQRALQQIYQLIYR